ncbi:hypothetical protein ACE1AT_11110 [Pelatocladus sp. BLCC-F211]|uniref:hypothetical protein n=1 Tax=Pelatocladus sp. BLCC-F211 TaxID=3342752 RepID=UPI0035B9977A
MTFQTPDTFIYRDKEYALVDLTGEELITPQETGFGVDQIFLEFILSRRSLLYLGSDRTF